MNLAERYGLIKKDITQDNLAYHPSLLHKPQLLLDDKGRSLESTMCILSYMNPYTPVKRLALVHSTGTGKTRKALLTALQYNRDIAVVVVHSIQAKPFISELDSYVVKRLYPGFNKRLETITCRSIMTATNKGDTKRLDYYFKNRVIIVDEVHHVRNRGDNKKTTMPLFETIVQVLTTYKDSIIMLLTATPLVDNVGELVGLYTLLKGSYPPQANYNMMTYALSGYISKLDKRNLPTKEVEVRCMMVESGEQWRLYQKHQDDRSSVYTKISAISRFITNDDEGATEYRLHTMVILDHMLANVVATSQTEYSMLYLEALRILSAKYYMLIKNLREYRGHPHFIFDVWKKRGGMDRLLEILTMPMIGYIAVTTEQEALDRTRGLKLVALHKITSKGSTGTASKLLDVYNSDANRDGSLIDVLLATPKFSESMSVRTAKYKHNLNSFWNIPGKHQVDGRINRRTSLMHETTSNRYIVNFNYVLYKPNGEDTFESEIIKQAEAKYQHVKPVLQIMEEIKLEKLLVVAPTSASVAFAQDDTSINTLLEDAGTTHTHAGTTQAHESKLHANDSVLPADESTTQSSKDILPANEDTTLVSVGVTRHVPADSTHMLNTRINNAVRMYTPTINYRNLSMDVDSLLANLEQHEDLFSLISQYTNSTDEGYIRLTSAAIQAIERLYISSKNNTALSPKQESMLADVSKAFVNVEGNTMHLLYFINEDTVEYQRMSRVSRRVVRQLVGDKWVDVHNAAIVSAVSEIYKNIQLQYVDSINAQWMRYGYYVVKYILSACYRLVEYREKDRVAKSSLIHDVDNRKLARGEKWLHYNKTTLTMLLCKLSGYGPKEYVLIYKRHKTANIFLAILQLMTKQGMLLTLPV